MPHYNLDHLAGLYGPEMDKSEALKRAEELRRALHALDKNEANNDKRHQKLPVRIVQRGGYQGSGVLRGPGARPTPRTQPEDPSNGWCQRIDVEREMSKLKPRTLEILKLREEGYTFEEIAERVDLSSTRVQQIEKAAKQAIQAALERDE